MPAGRFAAIIRKVSEHVQLGCSAKLTFEVSDGVRPMQLYCATQPTIQEGAIYVDLAPRAASCKPRDRWLAEESQKASAYCSPTIETGSCCS